MTQTHEPLTTSREERGRAIAEKSGQIQKVKDNQYKVRSQSGNGSYEIKITGHGAECSCPDFQNRRQPCKHILGLRYYLEVQKDTPTGHRYRESPPDLFTGMERVQRRTDGGDQDIRCSVERLGKSNP